MTSSQLRDTRRQLHVDAIRLAPEFSAFRGLAVALPERAFVQAGVLGFYLRVALEQAWFVRRGVAPHLAEMAAARAGAQFIQAEAETLSEAERAALPGWVEAMAGGVAPPVEFFVRYFDAQDGEIARIREVWALLGTAEALMETGGDIRLARDPRTALNGYGCSHRPRPWAVTFASSTASSSSERGYEAADRARLRATLKLLRGGSLRAVVRQSLQEVRRGLAAGLGLPPESAIVLAASGTDSELLALALTCLGGADVPILNILVAPEETGRGVPMAARGTHFAIDTALGHDVTYEAPIAGFRPDTALANIPLREKNGTLRAESEVEAEIYAAVAAGIGQGRRVILHALDLSKTGLLAPGPAFLARLRQAFGAGFDIVVDACQARLSGQTVQRYLALEAVVLITGSKFFTGPPFAGAAILPGSVAARLEAERLPQGLGAYFGRDDFPARSRAARVLPPVGNYGLALRWQAALAEMRAFLRVPGAKRAEIIAGFGRTVVAALGAQPALRLLDAPPLSRGEGEEDWERLRSIFTFSLQAPMAPSRCLMPAEARSVYLWLNTDLSPWLPEEGALAARICHIGQPVPLPQPLGEGLQGALRVSAGARLVSGEPSHRGLAAKARLAREFGDLTLVFKKIALILRHWEVLAAVNPVPRYRPAQASLKAAARRTPVL